MTESLSDIVKSLRDPYGKAIMQNALGPKGDLRGLSQIIAGPSRSGKTTEAHAYAAALAKAGLVDAKQPILVYAGSGHRPEDWIGLFNAAEKGVIIIDEIYRNAEETRRGVLRDLMLQTLDAPKCVLILTGDKQQMDAWHEQQAPELRARMPRMITTDKSFSEQEIRLYHENLAELLRLQQEKEERMRCSALWHALSEDVTLKRSVTPMKGLVLLRKNDTVS
ncbi:MAG: AAA family ATPase [Alphaproteobacteria bacterium]